MPMPAISLGDKVRDTISGFEGTVVARHEYLNGCVRLSVQPNHLDKDGKPYDCVFDIEQLEKIEPAKPRQVEPSGGPRDEPPARPALPAR